MTAEHTALDSILKARHSCRAYLDTPVPRELIKQAVATAARAPSWCNAQPWHLLITEASETARLGKALHTHAQTSPMQPDLPWPESYSGAYKARRFDCGMQLYDAASIERDDKPARTAQMLENFNFFGAPHMALVSSPHELGAYGALDCGGFVTAFCAALTSLGLGSIPQAAPAGYAPFLREYFALPDDRLILCAVSFGYSDTKAPINSFRTPRAALSDLVDWR
ncbi:nitroreductase [Lentibacter sp. XHP0401]|jgi:nitroreductase|uniref:nitroreductase n=1 Tax=Lentibacter sp. XHP0401 TaxID=2984334 RepID=UPI0021E8D9B7|nr:nitroreductase [Lentibacter sp. XHP0401]MCV2891538.1 nitroreductase [Lentibacter sp. XHP0401]